MSVAAAVETGLGTVRGQCLTNRLRPGDKFSADSRVGQGGTVGRWFPVNVGELMVRPYIFFFFD